jgi:RHS repeat-associated protein
LEQIDNTGGTSVISSTFNNLNQVTASTAGGLLSISGSLGELGISAPGTVTVSGSSVITDANGNFTIVAPVVSGSNSIPITATDANNNQTNKTLQVNVTGGTPIAQLQYDLNGNLVNDGTMTYEWDAANRLTAVNEPGGGRSEFAYDGLGRRVRITEKANGTVTSVKNLIWDGTQIAEARNQTNTITNRYFNEGVWISGTSFYYTRDHLGSIRELVDGTGNVRARYDYDPYGRQTQLSGTLTADFGFTGFYYHQPSGLQLAPYREYSANLGRWISRDPISERGGLNLYDYVRNQPIHLMDALGLCPQEGDACSGAPCELETEVVNNGTRPGDVALKATVRITSEKGSCEDIHATQWWTCTWLGLDTQNKDSRNGWRDQSVLNDIVGTANVQVSARVSYLSCENKKWVRKIEAARGGAFLSTATQPLHYEPN